MEQKINSFSERIIYEDEETIKGNTNNSLIKNILNYSLLGITVLLTTILLMLMNKSIFPEKMLIPSNLRYLFNFQSQSLEQLNALIIFRFLVIGFVYFYSIVKNYNNLYLNKAIIKKYIPWYFIYLSITIISFGLFFGYFEIYPSKIVNLINLLVALFVINTAYTITNYFNKRKNEPILYKHITIVIVPIIAQLLLLVLVITLSYIWVHSGTSKNVLFYENKFFNWIRNLFTIKAVRNLLLLLLFFAVLFTFIIAANYEMIFFIIYKKYNAPYLKNKFYLIFTFIVSLLIWFIKVFTYKHNLNNIFGIKVKKEYLYFLEIFFVLVITALYIFFNFFHKIKINGNLNNLFLFISTQLLIWTSLLVTGILNEDSLVLTINTFFASLSSLTVFFVFWLKNKKIDLYILIMFIFILLFICLTLFVFGLNYVLTSSKYGNYFFMTIVYKLTVVQILLVLNISILISLEFIMIAKLLFIIIKTNKEKEKNEKIIGNK
ncbi:MAG: MSC_0624 family F1-like ATPase-associated membrane protein [Metamycoplasmataceae bacterium]